MRAEKFYSDRIQDGKEKISILDKRLSLYAMLRLGILLVACVAGYYFYKNSNLLNLVIVEVLLLLAFIVVAINHGKNNKKKEELNILIEINEKGLKRLSGEFKKEEDMGEDLIESNHSFCEDLDIFGYNSLFQYVNTTRTKSGRKKLKEFLLIKKLPTKEEIKEKQEAIKELGEKIFFRQDLYIKGAFKKNKKEELEELISWGEGKVEDYKGRIIISLIFIVLTLILAGLSLLNVLPFSVLILDLMINFIVIKMLTRDRQEIIKLFISIRGSVSAYGKILALMEKEEFKSSYLRGLQKNIKCSLEMEKLNSLLDWIGDSMGNAYYFLVNIFAFCDVFILFNLEKWKKKNGSQIGRWLSTMGEIEALSSISNIAFDHENWTYGRISNEEIVAVGISHPLIGSRAVENTYILKSPKEITLITGSNMSGKSTFLRTIGINMVLTYIGAPSSSKEFTCPILNIYTCMRTKDNLEESISSFYAEILRIKLIIEGCKKGEKAFVLLDEIFKGTNSKDRHLGAKVLIKQLIDSGAKGLVSTHDLELCDLEEELKEVENYNFREYYEDNKIYFDYKLREGKSTTQNAVYLMKMAGIEF